MQLGISNIGWSKDEDTAVLAGLGTLKYDTIEVAPLRVVSDLFSYTDQEARDYVELCSQSGLSLGSMQSLLFGQPQLQLFEDPKAMLNYLEIVCVLAKKLGATQLVFGSPKNRIVPPVMTESAAEDIAIDFFRNLGTIAQNNNVVIVVEPNPELYGCNFLTNTDQAATFVRRVSHPAVRLHYDLGISVINNENITETILSIQDLLEHVHVSDLNLQPLSNFVAIQQLFDALKVINYQKYVVIEMKMTGDQNIETVLSVAQKVRALNK